jgi:hypothetical protein
MIPAPVYYLLAGLFDVDRTNAMPNLPFPRITTPLEVVGEIARLFGHPPR